MIVMLYIKVKVVNMKIVNRKYNSIEDMKGKKYIKKR